MKKILLIALFFLFNVLCFGRRPSAKVLKKFTNCYTGKATNIRSKLNIDGYFDLVELGHWTYGYGKHRSVEDSSHMYFIFYEDGTFLSNPTVAPGYLDFTDYWYALNNNDPAGLKYIGEWGVYSIDGDTIKAQWIDRRKPVWRSWEERYKIVDRNTLVFIGSDNLFLKQHNSFDLSKHNYLPAKFIACDTLPLPNSWLKEEKWIWCK